MNKTMVVVLILVIAITGWFFYQNNNKLETENVSTSFGDDGDEGGTLVDSSLAVSQNIIGKWQSVEDPKFVREFKADGVVVDTYENQTTSTDTWAVFTKDKPLQVSFPLEAYQTYIQIVMSNSNSDTLNFKVTKVTPEDLELIYMDRGGVLVFKRI